MIYKYIKSQHSSTEEYLLFALSPLKAGSQADGNMLLHYHLHTLPPDCCVSFNEPQVLNSVPALFWTSGRSQSAGLFYWGGSRDAGIIDIKARIRELALLTSSKKEDYQAVVYL